ncbi:hypothetical protein Dda_5261 [Drechslerella dactyloides]|uniref:Rhodopsin domain-containing protein n=1 Tax=Drechslerella dactyloides TaxID=74499 RepID=A0AAD6IVR6_DREDA|nr:hypothetical protein Dda_5261 [Drechslerella dactyloides]
MADKITNAGQGTEALPHDSRGPEVLAAQLTLTTTVLILVPLRLYTRRFFTRSIGLDDWLISVVGVLLVVSGITTTVLVTRFQAGQHMWDITPSHKAVLYKAFWGLSLNSIVVIGTTRFSVLATYLRLFSCRREFCIVVIVTIVVNICLTVSLLIATLLTCRPLNPVWKPTVHLTHDPRCFNEIKFLTAASALSMSMDIWVWFLPLKPLWDEIFAYIIYTMLEENLGAIAASIMMIKPLIQRRWPNFMRHNYTPRDREAHQLRMAANMARQLAPAPPLNSLESSADVKLEKGLKRFMTKWRRRSQAS